MSRPLGFVRSQPSKKERGGRADWWGMSRGQHHLSEHGELMMTQLALPA
jgi:hypothetical protein